MNRFTHVAAVALAVFVTACADGPTTPDTASSPQLSAAQSDLARVAKYAGGPPNLLFGYALRIIGPAGGTVKLLGFEVVVPPGAVSRPTVFTIRLPADPFGRQHVYAEFGPHGQQFAVPVTIKLPYDGTTSEGELAVHVLWFNGSQWVPFQTSLTGDGRIQAQTNHFSDYGTEQTTPQKGVIVSGKPQR